MNVKTTTNSQLSTTESEKQKQKLSKQLEQGQNQKNADHMEGFQWGGGGEEWGKGTGNKKHKWQVQNRERLRIVQEIETPKDLYVRPMDMN